MRSCARRFPTAARASCCTATRRAGRSVSSTASSPARSDGPFLHAHDFAETFYIVEGELTFQLHDELVTATAGEIVVAPGGAPHTFANHSGADARFAMAITPAGFERHFARIAARRAETEPPDWALGAIPDVERVGPQISG